MSFVADIVDAHRNGRAIGVFSVCSSHPLVIEASMRHAQATTGHLLLEATSNQVDQNGGYTGMTPQAYRDYVEDLAGRIGLGMDRIVLGGDHLGPNTWQDGPARTAMENAAVLIDLYARAGFGKIHLDCSMPCGDDERPLEGRIVAERAARLAKVAEESAKAEGHPPPLYIVGTEVPVPGGAREEIDHAIVPTDVDAARTTLEEHRDAFRKAGIPEAYDRVIGLVVQPGVEFDHTAIVEYDRAEAARLAEMGGDRKYPVFEAHSTDYQTREALRALVEDHFAILKVGPGLTFAMREALFALEDIERGIPKNLEPCRLSETLEQAMTNDPSSWRNYYHGSDDEKRFARRYSFSDRVRYYWQRPEVEKAIDRLFANLENSGIPLPLLSQYLPIQYERVRRGEIENKARDLVIDRITDVLRDYAYACTEETEPR